MLGGGGGAKAAPKAAATPAAGAPAKTVGEWQMNAGAHLLCTSDGVCVIVYV